MDEITLSPEQQAVFQTMEQTCDHIFLTGRAGTGKSVLFRFFRDQTKKKVIVCAPTGIAALNVGGQTIHSLFRLAPELQQRGTLPPNSRVCTLLKQVDTILIDEGSMVRADILDAIDERMREAMRRDTPFGGVQVIVCGDVFQLPPVVEEGLAEYFQAEYGGPFFFHAHVWGETQFKTFELTQVFRQRDETFLEVLNAVRDGSVTEQHLTCLNARTGTTLPAQGTVTLATTNALVTRINQQRLDQLPGRAQRYTAVIEGKMKRSTFPTEEELFLKKGAQVILLKNDQVGRWVNGTLGTIESLSPSDIWVRIGESVSPVERATWEEVVYTYDPARRTIEQEVVSSFTQYPLRLAWALTVHKSQGQTLEQVCLDLTSPTFAAGQLYVALSRCTSLAGLSLKQPVKRSHVLVDPTVQAFMQGRECLPTEKEGVICSSLLTSSP